MHQRDYILRLIEQLGSALVEIRNRILGRKTDAVRLEEELAEIAGKGGLDLAVLRGFDADTLHMFASPTGEVEPARCWLMAELLYLDGLQAHVEERGEDAARSLEKARLLFTLIEPGGGMLVGIPEAGDRVAEIDGLLEGIRGG